MLTTIEGVFRNGRVELLEPSLAREEARVFVTFLPQTTPFSLPGQEMSSEEAADLRARLHSFAEDWEHPGMEAYDHL